jgi:esterase/lipase
MHFYSGFSLQKEKILFSKYLNNSGLCVAGFSYGAQRALEHVYASKERVDRLILLSPAFFQEEDSAFVRSQLRYFETDKDVYVKQFLHNVAFPSHFSLNSYLNIADKSSLENLLSYKWEKKKIEEILARGTVIEVFFGKKDKIINIKDAHDFFKQTCVVYTDKNTGHLLKELV